MITIALNKIKFLSGLSLTFLLILAGLVVLTPITQAQTTGDTIRLTCNTNIRMGPGTSFGTVAPSPAPTGTTFIVLAGPVSGNGFNWYRVTWSGNSQSWVSNVCPLTIVSTSTPPPASGPVFNSFTVSPTSTSAGSQVTLSWSVSNVGNCRIKGGSYDSGGTVPIGSANTTVSQTTTFTLTCPDGSSNTRTATVTVAGAPASGPGCESPPIAIGQTDIVKNVGDNYTVNWKSNSLATSCTLYKGTGVSSNVPCTSSITESQSSAGQYSYRIAGTGRDSSGNTVTVMSPTVTVTLISKPQCGDGIDNDGDSLIDLGDPGCADLNDNDETNAPTGPSILFFEPVNSVLDPLINKFEALNGTGSGCTIGAKPTTVILPNRTSTLTWSCDKPVSSCTITDNDSAMTDIGSVASSGSRATPNLRQTTAFTLQCLGAPNSSVTVKLFSSNIKEVIPQ